MNNDFLDNALMYAKLGLPVFPIKPKGKNPLTQHGFKDASTDPDQIRAWWKQWPGANIGISTEHIAVLDIDVDPSKGIDGNRTLAGIRDAFGTIPVDTWTAVTGRGGSHLFYKPIAGQDLRSGANVFGRGLDLRAQGGYVVVPPSIHPNGNRYEWITPPASMEMASFPTQLILAMRKKHEHERKTSKSGSNANAPFRSGERNDRMFKLAVNAHKNGATGEAIRDLLVSQNKIACDPPLPDKELEAILKSATSYEGAKPELSDTIDIELTSMADVEEKEADWLIPGFVPKYTLTTLAGDGGVGKTTLWCNLAAGVSSGNPTILEDSLDGFDLAFQLKKKRDPMKVLFFSSEDDAAYTLVQKLKNNGADMRRIFSIPYDSDKFRHVKFSDGYLERIVEQERPDLIIFDPLQGFLSHETNMGMRNHMRDELANVTRLCSKYQCTAIVVMHTNKGIGNSGRGRMADSADIWDIARSCLFVGADPETGYRYLSHEKSNYGQTQTTILFSIEEGGRLKHEGHSSKKDRDFQGMKMVQTQNAPKRDAAAEAILKYLDVQDKRESTMQDMEAAMDAYGHSKDSVKRAKQHLVQEGRITIERSKEYQGKYNVYLQDF